MKNNPLAIILGVLILCNGCINDDIGQSNNDIFEYLWTDFDEHYIGFEVRNVDWDSVYSIYAPLVRETETEDQFWPLMTEMIDIFDDQHVSITDTDGDRGHASGKLGDELLAEKQFNLALVESSYLADNFKRLQAGEENMVYGFIQDKNIAYIHLPNFAGNGDYLDDFDQVIDEIKNADGLIIDVRNNGGGFPPSAEYIATRFAKTESVAFLASAKNGPGRNDYDEPSTYTMRPEGEVQFTKPIYALNNHSTVSAGEEFFLYLQTQDHVTILGDYTSNAIGDQGFSRLLPNGWKISMPVVLYTLPDGTSPEGKGITPDIEMVNDSLDIQSGIDKMLEFAIDAL